MAFTNELLLKTLQVLKGLGNVTDKTFLMLGKQDMSVNKEILEVLEESNVIDEKHRFEGIMDSVEFFLTYGFKEVHALDVSCYENADIIFDLNEELPKEFHGKYDVVYDGGVIEHVFDVANAFRNVCKMTKVGGYIFSNNPVGNYLYNTFWNISPEMFIEFYRVNHYKIVECSIITHLSEDYENRPWGERPVIWSPDIRFLNMAHPLRIGEYVRSLYKLCPNPHPETFIVAQKTNAEEFNIPIPSGYRKKHQKEKIERE